METNTTTTPFRLHRSTTDRMLGGVCGGLAESLGVDATLLRVALIILTVLGAGALAIVYVAIWVLAPEGPTVPTGHVPAGTPDVGL